MLIARDAEAATSCDRVIGNQVPDAEVKNSSENRLSENHPQRGSAAKKRHIQAVALRINAFASPACHPTGQPAA